MSEIRNCDFKFKCDQSWDTLKSTEDENVRFCVECERPVHFVRTQRDIANAIRDDKCIAVRARRRYLPGPMLVGIPAPPNPSR